MDLRRRGRRLPRQAHRRQLRTSGGRGTFRGVLEHLSSVRALRRSPRVAQVAATAAFLASDHAAAITGTFVNVTSGTFPS
ncbi:SDR family oxidoreductase [Nonomuraea turkmeniaca]|uniref:SDR family oxidoreductase n=1 Tax=Nonomuraea turkmeniaca TaxID=103838 RepID=A0A5S4EZU4_9ACTN|nr:SDR family oxidoreductase [Nonomuraea turkmeniaca]TMR09244.1 SDR family oxidoreductase [Nonomuraea turkmeniaca]